MSVLTQHTETTSGGSLSRILIGCAVMFAILQLGVTWLAVAIPTACTRFPNLGYDGYARLWSDRWPPTLVDRSYLRFTDLAFPG